MVKNRQRKIAKIWRKICTQTIIGKIVCLFCAWLFYYIYQFTSQNFKDIRKKNASYGAISRGKFFKFYSFFLLHNLLIWKWKEYSTTGAITLVEESQSIKDDADFVDEDW